jgi:hypothetical protein
MKTVIEMAREAAAVHGHTFKAVPSPETIEFITAFAKLVRADEREACAKVAEDSDHVVLGRGYYDQLGDADATVRNIVAAIRARSNT